MDQLKNMKMIKIIKFQMLIYYSITNDLAYMTLQNWLTYSTETFLNGKYNSKNNRKRYK